MANNKKSTSKNRSKSKDSSSSKKSKSAINSVSSVVSVVSKMQFSSFRLIVFLIICAIVVGVGFIFKSPIEDLINNKFLQSTDEKVIDENGLTVHFVDVGQGDAIAIKFPDGKTMLVDAGTSKSENTLVSYLNNNFFKSSDKIFDYVLLTHSDADHCGGMTKICKEFVINKIYRPYIYSKYSKNGAVIYDETEGDSINKNVCTTYTYYSTIKAFNSEINSNGENAEIIFTDLNTVNTTYKIQGEGYNIDFYAPTKNYITESAGTVANDFSPIMVLNYNGKKIMLTGDASFTSEQQAMARATLPDVDLLKVGHHGSATSSSEAFLNQIRPEISVISVGANNSYHHPTEATLNRLLAVNSAIYRTDKNGNVVANITSGETVELNIFTMGSAMAVYIHVEYLMAGIVAIAFSICFVKIKKSKSQ